MQRSSNPSLTAAELTRPEPASPRNLRARAPTPRRARRESASLPTWPGFVANSNRLRCHFVRTYNAMTSSYRPAPKARTKRPNLADNLVGVSALLGPSSRHDADSLWPPRSTQPSPCTPVETRSGVGSPRSDLSVRSARNPLNGVHCQFRVRPNFSANPRPRQSPPISPQLKSSSPNTACATPSAKLCFGHRVN